MRNHQNQTERIKQEHQEGYQALPQLHHRLFILNHVIFVGKTEYNIKGKRLLQQILPQGLPKKTIKDAAKNKDVDLYWRIKDEDLIAKEFTTAKFKSPASKTPVYEKTEKHFLMGLGMHKLTGQKGVVELLHKFGHCTRYILTCDILTTNAESAIEKSKLSPLLPSTRP